MELLLGVLFGFVSITLIVLLVVFISKTNTIIQRMHALEAVWGRLQRIEEELAGLRGRFAVPKNVVLAEPSPPGTIAAARPLAPSVAAEPPARRESVTPSPAPAVITTARIDVPKPPPSRTREEWEALIGGKLLNRIGALALIIGMGFFLKYAFDNNWITETMRVLIGLAIGAGLLVMAAWAHRKGFEVFSQGLVGAGLSVLYLSVFASFNFYHLVPQVFAFLMMSVVTILAFLQAFRYDSFAVSVLGLLGGFLTPFLLSTGSANEVGLLTYIALLDAGLLAVVLMKDKWAVLEPIALCATYLVYVLWYKEYYVSEALLTTVYFLIVFWGLFHCLTLYRDLRSVKSFSDLRGASSAANVLLFYVSLYSLIEPEHHSVMGLVTACLALVCFGSAMLVLRRSTDSSRAVFRQVLAAIVLLVLATAIEFTGFRTVQWWSVEALALVYCGVRWNTRFVWVSASVLFAFALVKILFIPESFGASPVIDFGLLLNQRSATLTLFSASMAVGAFLLKGEDEPQRKLISRILDYVWPVVIFAMLTAETVGYFKLQMNTAPVEMMDGLEFRQLMTLPVIWMIYSLILSWSGLRWNMIPWNHVGLGVALVAVCLAALRGITYEPIQQFSLVANFRFVSMAVIIGGAFVHAQWIRNKTYLGSWNADILGVVGVIIVILIFDLITGETKDIFQRAKYLCEHGGPGTGSPEWTRLSNLQQLALSAVWLLYSIGLMVVGIWRRQRGIRIASFVLFGFTILKIFIYDLSFLDTLYRIFSFIGLGVILLAVSYVYQRYKDVIFGMKEPADT